MQTTRGGNCLRDHHAGRREVDDQISGQVRGFIPPIDEATARTILTVRDVEGHVIRELKAAGKLRRNPS